MCLTVRGPDSLTVERLEQAEVSAALARRGRAWEPEGMYILSRRPRPGLVINGEVLIAVQAISNESVRLGIEAPPHVLIYREEVYQQMQEANRAAGRAAQDGLAHLAGRLPQPPRP